MIYTTSSDKMIFRNGKDAATNLYVESGLVFLNDTWYYIVATWSGVYGEQGGLYINGELNASNSPTGSGVAPVGSLQIGKTNTGGPTSDFKGMLDELKIYNRSLSAEQIYKDFLEGNESHSVQTLVSQETVAETWTVAITPNDGTTDGTTVVSNNLTVIKSFTILNNGSITKHNYFEGSLNNITYSNSTGDLYLSSNKNTGNFTSQVFDTGSNQAWNNISWIQGGLYQEELPDNQAIETTKGGANMTGNILLMHMNNNWEDESGNNNDGIAQNGANFTTNYKLGSHAGNFDGNSDYLTASFSWPTTGTFSIWVKPNFDIDVISSWQYLWKLYGAADDSIVVAFNPTADTVDLDYYDRSLTTWYNINSSALTG